MGISNAELERQADDIYKDRRIASSTYCGQCGYNLRTLPYAYTCPECGQKYNARALRMEGIFLPHEISLPTSDAASLLLSAGAGTAIGWGAFAPLDPIRVLMALVLVVFAIGFLFSTINGFVRFIKATRIARRVALEEAEEHEE